MPGSKSCFFQSGMSFLIGLSLGKKCSDEDNMKVDSTKLKMMRTVVQFSTLRTLGYHESLRFNLDSFFHISAYIFSPLLKSKTVLEHISFRKNTPLYSIWRERIARSKIDVFQLRIYKT